MTSVDLLLEHPILLLFLVIGLGSALGRLSLRGFALGPAAVLFVGLAISAIWPELVLSEDIMVLGLALFTYTVGLATGPSFVAGLRGRGLRWVVVVLATAGAAALTAGVAGAVIGLSAVESAGLFTGATTNTPALGAVVDATGSEGADAAVLYALAYPAGVLVALLAAWLAMRRAGPEGSGDIVSWAVAVTTDGARLGDVDTGVSFGRCIRAGVAQVATPDTVVAAGDLLTVVGPERQVASVAARLGQRVQKGAVALDRSTVDFRRITVSAPDVVGRRLGELDLAHRFGATATRIRRGDVDMVARDDAVLEAGDRVRVVAPVEELPKVSHLLGDSETQLADIDFVALSAGLAAGVLVGTITFPGGLRLGAGGGALLAGLVLGALSRVGPMSFGISHQVGTGMRHLGTVVFLAAVGTRSGEAFASAAFTADGARAAAASVVVVAVAMVVLAWTARRIGGLDGHAGAGAVAGMQTQPAVLAFADTTSGHSPQVPLGYTALYPAAMVAKIVLAQLLARL